MKVCFSLMFLLFISYSHAQKPLKDFYLKRSLKQNEKQWEFTVLDEDKRGVWRYDKSKFYFWYRAQKVMSTQGGASGVLLHGNCEAFYQNKQLAMKGCFVRGLKHGEWLYWRQNGTLSKSEQWSKGVQRGVCKIYDENGIVTETIKVKRFSSERTTSDSIILSKKHGKSETISLLNDKGEIYLIEERKNGELHGKSKTYEDGKLVSCEKYRNGELISQEKEESSQKDGSTKEIQPEKEQKKFFSFLKKKDKEEKKGKKEKEDKSTSSGKKNKR